MTLKTGSKQHTEVLRLVNFYMEHRTDAVIRVDDRLWTSRTINMCERDRKNAESAFKDMIKVSCTTGRATETALVAVTGELLHTT